MYLDLDSGALHVLLLLLSPCEKPPPIVRQIRPTGSLQILQQTVSQVLLSLLSYLLALAATRPV